MTAEDETVLNDLLDRWEEARARGEQPDPAELCRERPDLLGEFVDRVGALLWCEVLEEGPPEVEDETVPDVLDGRYRVRGRLGKGNQGDVWRAYDPLIQREVAVKMPRVNGEHVLAEARMIASLQHSNIIKVLDAGHDPCGRTFVVTELMPGRTLAERIRTAGRRRVPVGTAIRWIEQIASALDAVHDAGRAHRDVKPVNILLDKGDNAVLTDFGIAIDLERHEPGGTTGSPAYRSPEQLAGESLDGRSDVYSLGLVAHELLAGGLPFTNLDDPAAIEREITSGVDMQVSRRVPARLRPVVIRALALHPARRHETAMQFARELRWAWRFGSMARGLAVATALAVAAIALLGWRIRQEQRRADEAVRRQTEHAMQAAREGMRLHDETRRKVGELLDLNDRIIEETRGGPFTPPARR